MIATLPFTDFTGTREVDMATPPRREADLTALARGYRSCEKAALGMAFKLVGDDAADVVNGAALRMVAAAEDPLSPKPIPTDAVRFRKTFLTIVRNLALDRARKVKRDERVVVPLESVPRWDETIPRLEQEQEGGHYFLGLLHMYDCVGQDLTPRQREVITYVANGYTRAQITRHLGITGATYDGHVNAAFATMRKALLEQLPELADDRSDPEELLPWLADRWKRRQANKAAAPKKRRGIPGGRRNLARKDLTLAPLVSS